MLSLPRCFFFLFVAIFVPSLSLVFHLLFHLLFHLRFHLRFPLLVPVLLPRLLAVVLRGIAMPSGRRQRLHFAPHAERTIGKVAN